MAPECWTEARLARSVRDHAAVADHPSAGQIQQGTLSTRLAAQDWHLQRVPYSLQRKVPHWRGPDGAGPPRVFII